MAQGTTITSTGTNLSGGEGGGTHSAILGAINQMRLLQRLSELGILGAIGIKGSLNLLKNIKDRNKDSEDADSEDKTSVEIKFEQDEQASIAGQEGPKMLRPVEDTEYDALPRDRKRLKPAYIKEDDSLLVEVSIGELQIRDRYSNIKDNLKRLDTDEKSALDTAFAGGLPDREVSIKLLDTSDRALKFHADSSSNSGWTLDTENSTINISAEEANEKLQEQQHPHVENIRTVMNETVEGPGTHIVPGPRFTIAMDHNTVFVIDNSRGTILDAVELEDISGEVVKASQTVNGMNRSEQVREAKADFPGAVVSSVPLPRKKQQELTP